MQDFRWLKELWQGKKIPLGQTVERLTAALPQTALLPIYTISGGRVMVTSILGEVTTIIGGVANVTRFTHIPTGLAEQNLCALIGGTDINALAVGSFMGLTGVPTDAMLTGLGVLPGMTMPLILAAGVIQIRCAGSDGGGGRVKYTLKYLPYDAAASIAPA